MSKLPLIKRNIERFLDSEEGKISQKSIIDLGISVVALSLLINRLMPPQNVAAFTDHVNCHANCHANCHSNVTPPPEPPPPPPDPPHANCHSSVTPPPEPPPPPPPACTSCVGGCSCGCGGVCASCAPMPPPEPPHANCHANCHSNAPIMCGVCGFISP